MDYRSGREVEFIIVDGSQGVKKKGCEGDVHLYTTFHRVMTTLSAGMRTGNQIPQWIRGVGQDN